MSAVAFLHSSVPQHVSRYDHPVLKATISSFPSSLGPKVPQSFSAHLRQRRSRHAAHISLKLSCSLKGGVQERLAEL